MYSEQKSKIIGPILAKQNFRYLESTFSLMNTLKSQILVIAIHDTAEVIKNAKVEMTKKQPLSSSTTPP
jgi:Zn-dependent M28 family amino/carboxypeptidase